MPLAIGTVDGLYRAENSSLEEVESVLDDVKVYDIAENDGVWYAATVDGVFRAEGGIGEWEQVGDLGEMMTAVEISPDGERVYVGTLPAAVYESTDDGGSWRDLSGFHDRPIRDHWFNDVVPPHVRSIRIHPDAPGLIVTGTDGGGIHVSEDGGETWEDRMTGITQYVHDILVLGEGTYIASTDAGLFGTRDHGEWWDFLFTKDMKHKYIREAFKADGVFYAGAARSTPGAWKVDDSADAGLYEVRWEERAPDMRTLPYPGEPEELVNCGASGNGETVAGTTGGQLIRLDGDEWVVGGDVPGNPEVRKIVAY